MFPYSSGNNFDYTLQLSTILQSVTQQQRASAIGNLKEAAKESVESVQKEEDSVVDNEVDELQTMLEEAWNAEGMEGSAEEIKAFWEGMLERKEQGEVWTHIDLDLSIYYANVKHTTFTVI